MKKIAVIYMGGTFGCIGEPLSPMPAESFLKLLQQYCNKIQDVNVFAAPCIKDSSELTISDWLALSLYIKELLNEYQYFILIHGTDTLNYAAAFLHHIFADKIHLIITGSQYPLLNKTGQNLYADSDAGNNLSFALDQITQIKAGIYIGFNQQIFYAQTCYKLHTQDFQAFLGKVVTDTIYPYSLNYLEKIDSNWIEQAKQIRLLNYYLSPSHADHLAENLTVLQKDPPNIMILQAFGSGNLAYSEKIFFELQQLISQGCWVILTSQVLYGKLSQIYATGSWLAQLNLVIDSHHSQADLYARAMLLYLQYHQYENWQQFWILD